MKAKLYLDVRLMHLDVRLMRWMKTKLDLDVVWYDHIYDWLKQPLLIELTTE